ncbi:hypothetical protein ACS15_0879 [Ralstonia insidiosa]|uniref:Uncharacterized protein n=1 Tax=Ralstonia insidiosa TaxID=190721 RepID=A0AAC9BHA9_9RALS|nr:hypothetical protein ACS15_0879 [Ralstonia insidiosa]
MRHTSGPELEVRSCHSVSPRICLLFLPDGIRTIVLFSTVVRTAIFKNAKNSLEAAPGTPK